MSFIFFNLLVNSIFSLAIGLMIVYFFIWFFRISVDPWKIFFLSLPFIKIIYDFARGVPEKSILFSGVDPFSLPPKHQLLTIGSGLDGITPYINVVFSVNGLDGTIYSSSIGDYLLLWLHRNFGSLAPAAIVITVLSISAGLLFFRILQFFKFEKSRQKNLKTATTHKFIQIDRRTVRIYISDKHSGTPFTGGVFQPYICIPKNTKQLLTTEELDAVIAHEIGHIRYYDVIGTILIQCLGDIFWFVPGYRWLSRKIDYHREIAADNWAISKKVEPYLLASAMLKLKEMVNNNKSCLLYSAFFREKSLLKERISRLTGQIQDKPPRYGWKNRKFRFAVAILISLVVLNSAFGGNFKNTLRKNPDWFNNLFNISCTCVTHKFTAQV